MKNNIDVCKKCIRDRRIAICSGCIYQKKDYYEQESPNDKKYTETISDNLTRKDRP
jgi:hypothetical protein